MDAAEIAGLECSFQCDGFLSHSETEQLIRGTKSLLDALEQAQKERDEAREMNNKAHVALCITRAHRDAAQKDAKDASALLVEAHELLGVPVNKELRDSGRALRARIEAILEQKL